MKSLRTAVVGAFLATATLAGVSAEDTHHTDQTGAPSVPSTQPSAPQAGAMAYPGMPGTEDDPAAMMSMMKMMGQAGMMPMMTMMGPNGVMAMRMMGGASATEGMPMGGMTMMPMSGMGMPWGTDDLADHLEGRLAFLKAELKITSSQEQAWRAFSDSLRAASKGWQARRTEMMRTMTYHTDLPARFAQQESVLEARLDSLHKEKQGLLALYAILDQEQKRRADELILPRRPMDWR